MVKGCIVSAGACGSVVTLSVTLEMWASPVVGWSDIEGVRFAMIDGFEGSVVSSTADHKSGKSSTIESL